MDEERGVDQLVVPGCDDLRPPPLLAQQIAVVGADDQQRVVPQPVLVHRVEHPAERVVAHGEQRRVLVTGVLLLLLGLGDPVVVGPVEVRSFVVVRVKLLVVVLGEEGFVRVERLDLDEPVVLGVVRPQEFEAGVEGERLRLLRLGVQVLPVDPVLAPEVVAGGARGIGDEGVRDLPLPGIALLAPEELPGVVAPVVGRPAVLPVVLVVADEVGVDAVPLENLGHGVVERLQRTPAPVEEVVAPGVEFAAGRHAGHGARVAGVVGDRAFRQAAEVGGVGPVGAVRRQQVPVEAVEHHHDGLHAVFRPSAGSRGFRSRARRKPPWPVEESGVLWERAATR